MVMAQCDDDDADEPNENSEGKSGGVRPPFVYIAFASATASSQITTGTCVKGKAESDGFSESERTKGQWQARREQEARGKSRIARFSRECAAATRWCVSRQVQRVGR